MWYKFIKDEFLLKSKKSKELDYLYNNINNANILKVFLCKKIVLVLRMPQEIKRNQIGFHCTNNSGAINYPNLKLHYINGRKISNWIFDKYFNKTITFEDFLKINNEDEKAGLITLIKENEGNEGLLKFLNAVKIDEKVIIHTDNYSETLSLYKSRDKYSFLLDSTGKNNVEYAWIGMKCPSTGQSYLIDTCPTFTDVVKCAAWHRPKEVPNTVPYIWVSAN